MVAYEQLKSQNRPQPYPLPPENPQLGLSPVRSGPFASRNIDAKYAEHMKSIQELLSRLSDDVYTTKINFEDLSTRSRDNGNALEKLMMEIKGVREDDGVSKKLTGLAQLDRLDQLEKLNKLDRLENLMRDLEVKMISSKSQSRTASDAPQFPELRHLAKLKLLEEMKQLGNLKKLDTLENLNALSRLDPIETKLDDLNVSASKSLENSSQTVDFLAKLDNLRSELKALDKLDSLKVLESLKELNSMRQSMAELENLKSLTNLDKLDTIQDQLNRMIEDSKVGATNDMSSLKTELANLEQLSRLNELSKLSDLDHLSQLRRLDQLSELSKLHELENLHQLSNLSKLQSLDGLSKKISEFDDVSSVKGEIRAIQDHLVGIHRSTLEELRDLRHYKEETEVARVLSTDLDNLKTQVSALREEEASLRESVGGLKKELKMGIERLEDCESRYSRLEGKIREMTLSKYKGVMGTGALAVLSKNQQNQDKENGIVIPKRQLRTVSLANN